MDQGDKNWWRHGVFYQIYPRSFQDTNADGVGDLAGIIERLPYLRELGIDAIWLSPIFPSPMADLGYDISDYTDIDPMFGTMEDFDTLIAAVHDSGLKLILDLVPNHTSDQHPGSSKAGAPAITESAAGISGATASRRAGPRTTGYRNSAAAAGNMTRRPANIIIMPFSPSSRT